MSSNKPTKSETVAAQKTPAPASRVADVMHTIKLQDMIVHKYSEGDALIRKAHKVAYDLILQDLRPGEYVRTKKLGVFQVFFPSLTPEAGQLRCAVMADQIFRAIKAINPTYQEIAAADEAPQVPHPAPPQSRQAPNQAVRAKPRVSPRVAAPLDPHAEDMRRQASEAVKLMAGGSHMKLEELLAQAGQRFSPDQFDAAYHPMWMQAKGHVNAYRLTLRHRDAQLALNGDLPNSMADVAGILRAKKAVETLQGDGTPAIIVVPIQFATLETVRLRPALIEALASCSDLFSKYLVCDLMMPPGEISRFRLREFARYLLGRCRTFCARVTLDTPDLEAFAEAGFHAVGIDWMAYPWPERLLLPALEAFAERASACGLNTYLHRVQTRSGIIAAVGSGYSYIDGPAIHAPLRAPMGVRPYGFGHIYRNMLTPLAAASEGAAAVK